MKQMTRILILATLVFSGCKDQPSKTPPDMDAQGAAAIEEKAQTNDWITLFDGTSMDSWKGYGMEGVPDQWKIEEGAMVFYPPENKPEGANYNLVTHQEFTNFVLSLEWKISEGGNSGIFWGVREDPKYGEPYQTGPEIQVLDNERHSDAKNGTSHQAGALYDMVSPSRDVTKPAGEWNRCEITVDYQKGEGMVVMNGEEIVRFPLGDDSWDAMVAESKFAGWEGFGVFHTGKIGLQDHGDVVAYRSIRIKPL
jgi:hypothetical protein